MTRWGGRALQLFDQEGIKLVRSLRDESYSSLVQRPASEARGITVEGKKADFEIVTRIVEEGAFVAVVGFYPAKLLPGKHVFAEGFVVQCDGSSRDLRESELREFS